MTKELLDERLQKAYGLWVYSFGVLMAVAVLAGSWYGVKLVQAHDQEHRQTRQIQNANTNMGKRIANPYLQAEKVAFSLPYRHGADPYTLTHVTALQKHQKKALSGGFEVAGTYQSGNITHPVDMKLRCEQVLCKLSFELPANYVLPPRFDGRRARLPKRNFSLLAHGYEFQVENSQLLRVRRADSANWAAFDGPTEVRPYYKEEYLKADNSPIRAPGA